jgi:hypothetical protein
VFTLRISNHSGRVSLFDANGESEGLSIVIESNPRRGLINDGEAHVVEYKYSKRDLDRSDDNPYVSIIESLSEALKTGVYEDKTGLASVTEANAERAPQMMNEELKINNGHEEAGDEGTVRFRTENSEQRTESGEERAETGGKRSFGDRLLDVAVRMARRHAEDLGLRDAAVEALGERIGNLRKAMQAQQGYDFISLMFICDQYGAYYRLHKKRAATEYYDS